MERESYMRLCIKEGYSKRELEHQINSGYYERYMLSKEKLLPEPIKGLKENPFLDSYVIEFLDLPKNFKESDLRKGLIQNMKDFILEVGKDFTFIDEEYRVQVGGEDFRIDLLFFHRGLQCLVAFAGIEPGINESGTESHGGKMVKRGSSQLRYTLINCCLPLIRFDMTFATYYAKKRGEGKPHRVAITHVAKKLIRVIYALERQDIDFNAQKLR